MNFNNPNQGYSYNPDPNANQNPNPNPQQPFNPYDMFNMDINRQMQMNMPQFPQMNIPQFQNPMMPGFPQMQMHQMGMPNPNFPQQHLHHMGFPQTTMQNMGLQTGFNPMGFPQMDLTQVSGQPGTSYSYSSYSSSSTTTKDGQTSYSSESKSSSTKDDGSGAAPHKEIYENKTAGVIGVGGHKIEEKQTMYQNSTSGQYKAAHQRILDDQGIRLINEKNFKTGDRLEDSIYKGINENEASQFHQRFEAVKDDYSRNLELGNNTNTTTNFVPSLGMDPNVSNYNTSGR